MIVRNIPRHFVAPLSERGGCRVIPAQIVLFVAIADNHKKLIIINFFEFIEVAILQSTFHNPPSPFLCHFVSKSPFPLRPNPSEGAFFARLFFAPGSGGRAKLQRRWGGATLEQKMTGKSRLPKCQFCFLLPQPIESRWTFRDISAALAIIFAGDTIKRAFMR